MMRILKRVLIVFVVLVVLLVAAFVLFVGPWPTYANSHYADADYYTEALKAIDAGAAESNFTDSPDALRAGWASRNITPAKAPLAGYGARPGDKMATGTRDPVEVRVLALSDGPDTVVLVGADMLIIPPNLAELVRTQAAERLQLSPHDILLNASHTHCGPGGFAPGILTRLVCGPHDPAITDFLVGRFVDAIVAAVEALEPATLASGSVDAPQFIRNRTRDGDDVDPELSFLQARQSDGDECYLVSYNAHPTIFGSDMMQFSAEYPGELVRHIEHETHANAVYLGGAVGSMGPKAPEGPDANTRVIAMGQALANLVLEHAKDLQPLDHLDIASVGIPLGMPSLQLRPVEDNPRWRLSPLFGKFFGVPNEGWIHGVRVGRLLFMGLPCDFGGEISIVWKKWAADRNIDLWALSFNGAYCGYFSPDEHYLDLPLDYETGPMSWFGPNIEAQFTDLFHQVVESLKLTESPAA